MPPSLRRRAQHPPPPPPEPFSDSDIVEDPEEIGEEEEEGNTEDVIGIEEEEADDEEEEEPLASPTQSQLDIDTTPPPNLREISTLASWTVSSSKPGCSIPQLRSPSTSLFWQSDGPQPHWLNIHFFKLVRIVGLRLYLDFDADESYTPTRIIFLAGSGNNDLVEWGELKLEHPRGWIWADFSGVGEPEDDDGEEDDEDDEDSDDEDEDEDDEDVDSENGSLAIPGLDDAINDNVSDSENAAPDDPMQLDAHAYAQAHAHTTPIPTQDPNHPPTAPSSLPRPTPRLPFASLNPSPASLPVPRPPKTPRMPVLRAHLVQIRILENHQNGKDTHLRGLQIFAKDMEREGEGERRGVVVMRKGGSGGGDGGVRERMSVGPGMMRTGAGMGGGGAAVRGLRRSEWDVEPTIR
ncbi:galactose-binding domain-like protein [Massariosphaeria phaeospora]|uniref:Galactose-binding domain-like protein n=1 Tax=Massariosphaeria phaeospora TaxID=100035 RepID=A0A7C8I9P5_9PLEO|nr:galactose-binding domain-like protein [Massariosphaeria phaeospora]